MLLAGDVGGTKTLLALFDGPEGGFRLRTEATVASSAFGSLEDALADFLRAAGFPRLDAACLGVAGPVVDGCAVGTNLPWTVAESQIAATTGARRARLLNDLEAMAHGMLALDADAVQTLQAGESHAGTIAVIAAGTGLGEAAMVWDGGAHVVMSSEGGHADFAPRTDVEIALYTYLREEHGHVSWERVLSGPGLFNIYRFLRDTGRGKEPAWLTERLRAGDPSATVADTALAGGDALCVQALDLFVSLYGAEAGNLALKTLAVGGVWVGGGIGPKIRAKLADGTFVASFQDKGRMRDLMASIPVRLALDPRAGLLGAARVAARLAAL